MIKKYDCIVIGGGPAGYVGAIKSSQLGMKTLLIEKNKIGGTCLNVGCIPTKAFFNSAETIEKIKASSNVGIESSFNGINYAKVLSNKDKVVKNLVKGVNYLLKKQNVDIIDGEAYFLSQKTIGVRGAEDTYQGEKILIATGSENVRPPIPGIDGDKCIDSTELLSLTKLPKSITIIGGGVIGCEFANIMHSFGVEVSIVEMLPRLLNNMDIDCSNFISTLFESKGINVLTNARARAIQSENMKKVIVEHEGKEKHISSEYVLVATGRRSNIGGLSLEKCGVATTKNWIDVNDKMETNIEGIYAAGDITGKSFLAHVAYEEGSIAVQNMCGKDLSMQYNSIPKVVFVEHEIASVGMTSEEAKANGYEVIEGSYDISTNGKAMTQDAATGFVKVVSEKEHNTILGIHMVCASASEMITTATSLITMEATIEDVEATIYPHPSISEGLREACLDVLGLAIHK